MIAGLEWVSEREIFTVYLGRRKDPSGLKRRCAVVQTSREVSIEGMQPAVLKALLAYMYGCLSDIEPGMVHDLFRAADHYQVQHTSP